MRILLLLSLLTIIHSPTFSQHKMRTVEELINTKEPGWQYVKEWIDSATNKVEILPCNPEKGKDALYKTQVTTRSPMGAIIYMTGGLLVDHGWIRILGSGHARLNRTLPDWNKGKTFNEFGEQPPYLLVADDAIGGFFAINGGVLGNDPGKVYYLAPDNLEWEAMDMTYSDFLSFCFTGDLNKFYENLRWKGWEKEVEQLDGAKVYNFYPFLWTKEGEDINTVSRKPVPAEEQYSLNMSTRVQLGIGH
ncbi:Protein of unknown function DUF2625 [Chitinophaga rupis]|uniref:DUF2625 domain-containing protein n=2 Tax=Chitinophaga rupis TaxID=573321 RepID=A0A1H8G4L3_9BACT|nr:Protein of unknown function DUF2625 [Chitinophaga rupis]